MAIILNINDMINDKLIIDKLITIDDNGMPAAPNIRQLLDADVRKLYERDKTKDKSKYIEDCIIILYINIFSEVMNKSFSFFIKLSNVLP